VTKVNQIIRHDLRNKQQIISGYLALVLSEDKQGEKIPDSLRPFIQKSLEASLAIDDLLNMQRDFEEASSREPEWVSLETLIVRLQRTTEKNIRVGPSTLAIKIKMSPLYLLLLNLVDNTNRHSNGAREITISHRKKEKEFILIYEDNGVGVKPEEKKRIFEKGYGRNTGLGLFLIREILEDYNGTIKEVGEHGKGVRFEMSIPESLCSEN
jgi:signal transduction histidine kinase